MAAEQFNTEFWVAVAAVAPVIALAASVTADHAVKELRRGLKRAAGSGPAPRHRGLGAGYWISYINMSAQAVALLLALTSLDSRQKNVIPGIAVVLEFAGLLACFVP